MIFAPDYYKDFKCIADKCKHNCCIGWEIDVDDDTLNKYKKLNTALGGEILNSIDFSENAHFTLSKNDRCPFLDSDNLCRIIKEEGEGYLCDICRDHPRFRNFYDNFTEIGLGLCCEAAAELILKNNSIVKMLQIDNEDSELSREETEFLALREKIIDEVYNYTDNALEMIDMISKKYLGEVIEISKEHIEKLVSLERLDEEWTLVLNDYKPHKLISSVKTDMAIRQMTVYFILRHLGDSIFDNAFLERLRFCLFSVKIICYLGNLDLVDNLCQTARLYSSEIEYSEENLDTLIFTKF